MTLGEAGEAGEAGVHEVRRKAERRREACGISGLIRRDCTWQRDAVSGIRVRVTMMIDKESTPLTRVRARERCVMLSSVEIAEKRVSDV